MFRLREECQTASNQGGTGYTQFAANLDMLLPKLLIEKLLRILDQS